MSFIGGFSKTAAFSMTRPAIRGMRPMNAVAGLNNLTGSKAQEPFNSAMGHFGRRMKQGLKAPSRVSWKRP